MPVPSTARPRSVFFTTWYLQPLRRNSRRRIASFLTVMPRKSASTRLVAFARSPLRAAIFSSFTARSMSISPDCLLGLELGDQRQVVDLDAGAHGRGYRHRPHVRALRRLGL